jgi:hypothetical protein
VPNRLQGGVADTWGYGVPVGEDLGVDGDVVRQMVSYLGEGRRGECPVVVGLGPAGSPRVLVLGSPLATLQ